MTKGSYLGPPLVKQQKIYVFRAADDTRIKLRSDYTLRLSDQRFIDPDKLIST